MHRLAAYVKDSDASAGSQPPYNRRDGTWRRIGRTVMPRIRTFIVVLLVTLGAPSAATSQTRSAAPAGRPSSAAPPKSSATGTLPDIVGFRPGMSFPEARKLLRSHNSKATIDIGEAQIPELGNQRFPVTLQFKSPSASRTEAAEIIQLEVTPPPEKPVVWGIVRRLFFEAGKEMTRANLLAGLRLKYGPESYGITVPIVNLYWAFDEQGRRVELSTTYPNCAVPGVWDISLGRVLLDAPNRSASKEGPSTFPASSLLLGPSLSTETPCKPRVYVKAVLQPSGPRGLELIESTTVAVIDGTLAARAQTATAASRASALEEQKRSRDQKAHQPPKPDF